jgi:hypothetical protein
MPSGYLVGLLAGRPLEGGWDEQMLSLTRLMRTAKDMMRFGLGEMHHRRGDYAAVNTGISYGGGTKVG